MTDPRSPVVEKRLAGIGRIVAFCSAKGGVGKTFCAGLGALILAREASRTPPAVGLFDLDFQGASAHVLLGVTPGLPEEREGILPQWTPGGVLLLTAAAFTGDRPLPLRGAEVSSALLELLAVTQWGALDTLVIDMPPGIGEGMLDMLRLVPRLEAVIVSTPSVISTAVVERLAVLLSREGARVLGAVANMTRGDGDEDGVRALAARNGIDYLGGVPFDAEAEKSLGAPLRLLEGYASRALEAVLGRAGLLRRR